MKISDNKQADDPEREADLEVFNERAAIQAEAEMINIERTTEHALAALQQPDTHWGRHAVAKAWLRDWAPFASIFERVP